MQTKSFFSSLTWDFSGSTSAINPATLNKQFSMGGNGDVHPDMIWFVIWNNHFEVDVLGYQDGIFGKDPNLFHQQF